MFLARFGLADQCQITSPLPVPVSIAGCTFSSALPSNSTSYIQNTLAPSTTTQLYSVATATVTTSLTVPYLTAGQCLTTNAAGLIGTTSCGSGGSGGGVVVPSTFTWPGVIVSSIQATGSGVIVGTPTGANETGVLSRYRINTQGVVHSETNSSDANSSAGFEAVTTSSGNQSFINFWRSSGTISSPLATQSGQIMGRVGSGGYGATGWIPSTTGRMDAVADENFTDATAATSLNFYTTPSGSITPVLQAKIAGNGATTIISSLTVNGPFIPSSTTVLGNGQGTAGQVYTSQGGSVPTWTTPSSTGGGIVSAGTFTWTNNFGIQVSTLSVIDTDTTQPYIASIDTTSTPGVGAKGVWISTNGNVGISSQTPTQLLTVGASSTNNNFFTVDVNGNVVLRSIAGNPAVGSITISNSIGNGNNGRALMSVSQPTSVLPGFTFTGDTGTGIGNTGSLSHTLSFDTNGSEAAVFDANQNFTELFGLNTATFSAVDTSTTATYIATFSTTALVNLSTSTATGVFISTAGMVGIDTTTIISQVSLPTCNGTTAGPAAGCGMTFGSLTSSLYGISNAGGTGVATPSSFQVGTTAIQSGGAITSNTNGVGILLTGTKTATSGFEAAVNSQTDAYNGGVTSGFLALGNGSFYSPVSGTGNWGTLQINQVIDQLGSSQHITRGIYLDNTILSAYDYRNFETLAGATVYITAMSTPTAVYNVLLNPIIYISTGPQVTIPTASTLDLKIPVGSSDTVFTNAYGLYLPTSASSQTFTAAGIHIEAPTNATNNYAGQFWGGPVELSSGTFAIDGNVSPAIQIKGTGAPPDSQALCLLNGQLGHCTTVVSSSGGCTCSVP